MEILFFRKRISEISMILKWKKIEFFPTFFSIFLFYIIFLSNINFLKNISSI
jgi:hypothetical protein